MGKNALPYYKAYPRDFFEGTMGMDGELKGMYRMLIDAIYMKSGELTEDDRYIAGLLGVSLRKWRSVKIKLVDLGKIFIDNGIISNKRADLELETTSKYRDKQAENGIMSNKNKAVKKPLVNQPEPKPKPKKNTTKVVCNATDKFSIPNDWKPDKKTMANVSECKFSELEYADCLSEFIDYWQIVKNQKRGKKNDAGWNRAFRFQIGRTAKQLGTKWKAERVSKQTNGGQSSAEQLAQAFDDVDNRISRAFDI